MKIVIIEQNLSLFYSLIGVLGLIVMLFSFLGFRWLAKRLNVFVMKIRKEIAIENLHDDFP